MFSTVAMRGPQLLTAEGPLCRAHWDLWSALGEQS